MTSARSKHTLLGDRKIHANWECRYFTSEIPQLFLNRESEKTLGKKWESATEDDIYLLGNNATVNIKLRQRVNTIKVKSLLERTDDHFELWESTIDSGLPASQETWKFILTLLDARGDLPRLSGSITAADALCTLSNEDRDLRWVKIWKQRTFYTSDNARVEFAKTIIEQNMLYSIAFESHDLERARITRNKFPTEGLGPEKNYIEMLLDLQKTGKIVGSKR